MRTARLALAFSCIPLIANAAFPELSAPHLGELREFRTPNYTLVTQDAGTAKLLATELASMDGLLAHLLEVEPLASGKPTIIYVMRADTWHALLDRRSGAMFLPQRFANYILAHDHQRGSPLRSVICSEYTRLFLHAQFRGQYPFWLEEGLAGVMLSSNVRQGSASIIHPRRYNWDNPNLTTFVFSTDQPLPSEIPLRQVMKANAATLSKLEPPLVAEYNLLARLMVYRGLAADSARRMQTLRYLKSYDPRASLEAAVQAGFGMSVEQLEQAMSKTPRKQASATKFSFSAVPPAKLEKPVVLDELDAIRTLARALLESPDDAAALDRLLEQATSLSPGSTAVRTLRLVRFAQTRNDASLLAELHALEPDLKDAEVARDVGLALTERIREAEGPPEIRERAFALLDQSLGKKPDDAAAAWAFGLVAAQLKRELSLAEKRLRHAEELVPRSPDLAVAKAFVYAAMGQRELTLSSLNAVARYSRHPAQQAWARTRLEAMSDGAAP
ncbi:MAG TPA: hypothetical protein VFO82_14130 [Steroidobacteraceae bacterium]|nr:hypothetical protein [Steroidobacteraceae bacterium]